MYICIYRKATNIKKIDANLFPFQIIRITLIYGYRKLPTNLSLNSPIGIYFYYLLTS